MAALSTELQVREVEPMVLTSHRGTAGGPRTLDFGINNPLLYRLSYGG